MGYKCKVHNYMTTGCHIINFVATPTQLTQNSQYRNDSQEFAKKNFFYLNFIWHFVMEFKIHIYNKNRALQFCSWNLGLKYEAKTRHLKKTFLIKSKTSIDTTIKWY